MTRYDKHATHTQAMRHPSLWLCCVYMRRRIASPSFDSTLSCKHEHLAKNYFPLTSPIKILRHSCQVATPICRLSFWTNTRSTCFCCLVHLAEILPLITGTVRKFPQAMWDFGAHHMASSTNWGFINSVWPSWIQPACPNESWSHSPLSFILSKP